MTVSVARFFRVPLDPLHFWQTIHHQPTHGFYLGPVTTKAKDQVIYMSLEEPHRLYWQRDLKDKNILDQIEPELIRSREKTIAPRFVGMVGFDAGRQFDPGIARLKVRPNPLQTPLAFFGDYRSVAKVDLMAHRLTVYMHSAGRKRRFDMVHRIKAYLDKDGGSIVSSFQSSPLIRNRVEEASTFRAPSRKHFGFMVARAKEHIARGDVYQANVSVRFEKKFKGDPLRLYRFMCGRNPSPYACLLKAQDRWIVSSSPELLVKVKGRGVVTRPIAGTRPRGLTTPQDKKLEGQLLLSPKEQAEHIMLVDLERNDLGRVCVPHSVRVNERCSIERYSHVMHIVSQVCGRLAKGKTAVDALQAVFPGGTITGCPKIKAIQIIEELEAVSRSIFYGSVGFFSWNGDAAFNILIRSALIQKGKIFVQAGAGIVADSRADREYQEVLAKAQILLEAIRISEDELYE